MRRSLISSSRALSHATSLVAQGLPEARLTSQVTRCAVEAVDADFAAVFLQEEPGQGPSATRPMWRLAGHSDGDQELLAALPRSYGQGGGILAPLFQSARDLHENDLLNGAPEGAPLPVQLPVRSIVGVSIRRPNSRPIGVLLVCSRGSNAFDDQALDTVRSLAQLIGLGIENARLAAGQQRDRRMAAESAVTLGTVLESVGSGVSVVELDGTMRIVNKTLQDTFGLTGRMTGRRQVDVFANASVQVREADTFQQRLRELSADPSQVDESEWELATDPPRIVQRYSAPMRSVLGEVVGRVEVYTDITESRRLYTQLLNSEKLRAIGEMASGVAHDFNNLLASIVGQTELLHPDELPPGTRQAIATIRQAALDGARMVRNLQGLARPRAETPSTAADLNETVQLALEMARPRWAGSALTGNGPIDVSVNLADPAGLMRVSIDPAELREVLLNLLFNAADAMPEGGSIRVSTRPGRKPGTADLEVRDTGHGMPESVRLRIFEPFFSTKGPKGSGLGLAVAYSIITRRGGAIEVDSQPGDGTVFTITLPYAPLPSATGASSTQPPPTTAGTTAESPGGSVGATETPVASAAQQAATRAASSAAVKGARILVVDDEPGLVAIVRQLMERSGAIVSVANGGRAALDTLLVPNAQFDIVITDLDMPDVDGWTVASEVKTHRPNTRVVMLTGWAGEIAPDDFKSRGVDVVLAKPCSRAELESAISSLLAPKPVPGFDVLLVDDEPAFARAVRELLTLQGHRVTLVDSGDNALQAIDAQRFDVVLTDYSLGEMTGAQLADRLADREAVPFVVLVTGYATEIDDPSLLTRGVNAVLPKPCRGDDLRQVLARVPSL
ncbi:MAG TPA: response regulator [Chloroflexota bacterium]|nr:response regulator [Chloroflexota bacterium]